MRRSIYKFLALILLIAGSISIPSVRIVFAQPVNPGFETGDLTGWTFQGNVEVLQANNFNPAITPPEGSFFALLSSGPEDSPAPDNGDLDGDGRDDNDVTILSQTFLSGDGILSFYWCWLTDEEDQDPLFDDFFLVRLDGKIILSGSVDKTPEQSPFPNIQTDDIAYSVSSPGPTSGSSFGDGRSVFQMFSIPISAGYHTIEFIVADAGNHIIDSGLLIDDVKIPIPVGGIIIESTTDIPARTPHALLQGLIAATTTLTATAMLLAIKRKHKNHQK